MNKKFFDLQRFATVWYGTSGNDTLSNYDTNISIYVYGGNDSVTNSGGGVKIYGDSGDDYIYNSTYYTINNAYGYVTIDAGAGNDTIYSNDPNVSISGGSDNDYISFGNWKNITVNGGAGSDTIYASGNSYGVLYQYTNGDGNDYIYGFGSKDTLSISGSYTTTKSGNDLIYHVGNGSIYLKNYSPVSVTVPVNINNSVSGANLTSATSGNDTIKNTGASVKAYGYAGNDTIYNSGSYSTLVGGAGDDSITNIYNYSGGDYVSIDAGDGNDYIYNDYGWNLTVNGGADSDTIKIYRGAISSINGGAGDDKISLDSVRGILTIRGGAGNDTIYGDSVSTYGVIYQYTSGDGNDIIYNYHSNDTLSITGATSTRTTVGSNVIVSISGGGTITLVGGGDSPFTEGNDYYSNTTSNTVLTAFAGNDTIINSATKVTIDASAGDDKIKNTAASVSVYGGDGNDSIYNSSFYTTLNGGAGTDTINNYNGDYSYIDAGDGNDSIYAYDNDSVTLYAGAGSDTITGAYYSSKIYGGAGADRMSITGSTGSNTLDGGDGDDTISAYGGLISGGAGNDSISISSSSGYATISGGTGNDKIYGGYSNVFQYTYGDGSDTIYNYKYGDKVSIAGNSEYTTLKSGSNAVISVIGSGSMIISGAANKTLSIVGGTYKQVTNPDEGVYITNSTSNKTLSGTAKNDTITNIYNSGGDYVLIDAGAGNDTIYNNYGYYITMNGGAGNDTITSYKGSSNSINAGAGDDIVSLSSSKGVTAVRGGTGNDTIYGDTIGHVYEYANGDGNDVIYGYNSNDTITITSGSSWTKSTVGSDVVVKVGEGAMTLKSAKGKSLNIYPAVTPTPTPTPTVSEKSVIQTFMKVLDTVSSSGMSAINQAVSVASGGYFSNAQSAINQMISDCQNNSTTTFLTNYCGINLNNTDTGNTDTGAISGADAGGSTTKTKNSIVPESGSVNSFTGNSFTTNGLTVQLAGFSNKNPYDISYSNLSDATQRYIWQSFQTWWASGALDLIAESYGNNYGFNSNSSATVNKMYFGFTRENSGMQAVTRFWYSPSTGKSSKLAMQVNMHNYDSLIIGDSDGKKNNSSTCYLDRVLAHEMTHAVMAANVNYFVDLPDFIAEGMAELTHGVDDDREDEILYLANNPSILRQALTIDNYNSYAGGYMFLRYLAKQSSDHSTAGSNSNIAGIVASSNNSSSSNVTSQRGVTVKSGVLTTGNTFNEDMIDLETYSSTVTKVNASALTNDVIIIGNTRNNSIKAGKGADVVYGNTGNDSIFGGNGNDVLYGDAGNDIVYGETGNDTISGGSGKNTLTGGAGNDVFIHLGGNDLITDYEVGKDKIKIVDGDIVSSSLSGSNVIFNTEQGTVTIKGGKGKNITVMDKDNNETTKIYSVTSSSSSSTNSTSTTVTGVTVKNGILTVAKTFNGNSIDLANYATNVTKVNASTITSAINITGNSSGNSIKGGKGADVIYGEGGKDTIFGGAGNDVLYGGADNDNLKGDAGADTLYGGTGNDTLTGGAGNDLFVYESGNDFIADYTAGQDKIKITSGSITNASISGSNVVLKTDTGLITVKGGKGKKLTVIDGKGNSFTNIYPISTTPTGISVSGAILKASSNFNGTAIDLGQYAATVTKVNASAVTKAIKITGNSKNNSLAGGKGNDTLYGGAGADTLTGGNGNDVFVYSQGNDVITDYAANKDVVMLDEGVKFVDSYKSGSHWMIRTNNGTLKIMNGYNKDITVVDYDGYELDVSGLLADDNFETDELNLDSISEVTTTNYSVGKIENYTSVANLTNDTLSTVIVSNK